mgnify:CR=1 FL=1
MSEVESLYAKSEKIYPREVKGRFQRLRTITVYALLGLYYIMPFIQWHGRQAVLFDLPARKFHIFFLTFWPQDFFFLSVMASASPQPDNIATENSTPAIIRYE